MEMTREGNITVVTLSHRNLRKLLEAPTDGDCPGAIKKTEAGTLIVQVETDETHYATREGRC